MTSSPDVCLLRQLEEQLSDIKAELSDVSKSLLTMDVDDSDALCVMQVKLTKEIFECGVMIKKQLLPPHAAASDPSSTPAPEGKGLKLPKLDVPKFDGNIVNWTSFWEQYNISIHNRSSLTKSKRSQGWLREGSN